MSAICVFTALVLASGPVCAGLLTSADPLVASAAVVAVDAPCIPTNAQLLIAAIDGVPAPGPITQSQINVGDCVNLALLVKFRDGGFVDVTSSPNTTFVTDPQRGTFTGNVWCATEAEANHDVTIYGRYSCSPAGPGITATVHVHVNAATTLVLSSRGAAFDPQQVGTLSPSQSITLTNTGPRPLQIFGLFPSGADPGDFQFSSTCPSVVPAHTACSIQIRFQPTATGFRSGNVVVFSNAASSPDDIFLQGTGTAAASSPPPGITIVPTLLSFGDQIEGTVSMPRTITLTNSGAGPVAINSASIPPGDPFSVLHFAPVSLEIGKSTTLTVVFQPSAPGIFNSVLTVDTSGGTVTPLLAGFGVARTPAVTVSPGTLPFGGQGIGTTSAAQTITIKSTGTGPLTIFGIYSSGADPGDFPFTPACPGVLAPGESCTVQVSFHPTAAGARSANVVVFTNAPTSADAVFVTGTGQ